MLLFLFLDEKFEGRVAALRQMLEDFSVGRYNQQNKRGRSTTPSPNVLPEKERTLFLNRMSHLLETAHRRLTMELKPLDVVFGRGFSGRNIRVHSPLPV